MAIDPPTPPPPQAAPDEAKEKKAAIREQRARVRDRLGTVTNRISEQTRYICFGVLALAYGIFVSDSELPMEIARRYPNALWVAAIFAVAALLFDYLQYIFYFRVAAEAQTAKQRGYRFDRTSRDFMAGDLLFWAKQVATFVAVVLILWAVSGAATHWRPPAESKASQLSGLTAALEAQRREHLTKIEAVESRLAELERSKTPSAERRCRVASETWRSDGSFTRRCRD